MGPARRRGHELEAAGQQNSAAFRSGDQGHGDHRTVSVPRSHVSRSRQPSKPASSSLLTGAPAVAPERPLESVASTSDASEIRSVNRATVSEARSVGRATVVELKETARSDGDRARDLAPPVGEPDHRGVRRVRDSPRGTPRTHHRRMFPRSTRPPERDPLLATVGSLRDLVQHSARTSTWRFTLASASGCASFQLPLPTDNLLTRGLLLLAALGVGALAGRWLDRKRHPPRPSSPASTKSARSSLTTTTAAAEPTGASQEPAAAELCQCRPDR
jgi:hypothetical protein